jgi:hypothetical protein
MQLIGRISPMPLSRTSGCPRQLPGQLQSTGGAVCGSPRLQRVKGRGNGLKRSALGWAVLSN